MFVRRVVLPVIKVNRPIDFKRRDDAGARVDIKCKASAHRCLSDRIADSEAVRPKPEHPEVGAHTR